MTTLEAVNEILEWVGQPAVTALDTGGTSEAAEAENTLNRVNAAVQSQGWAVNETLNRTLYYPTIKIAVSGGTGTFTYRETVTESTSGAVGVFNLLESGFVYLSPSSGTFTGGRTLTGNTSGATRTGAAYTNITSTGYKIAFPSSYTAIVPSESGGEAAHFVMRGSSLWDTDNSTAVFTKDVHADVIELLAFTDIATPRLAAYIAKAAGAQFHAYKLRGVPLAADRQLELRIATANALQEDQDTRRANTLTTAEARAVKGNRYSSVYRALQQGPF